MSDFPTVLSTLVDGDPGVGTPLLKKYIANLEAKVGIDSSAVTTSLDYLLKNAASVSPGHTHVQAEVAGLTTASTASFASFGCNANGGVYCGLSTLDDTTGSLASLAMSAINNAVVIYAHSINRTTARWGLAAIGGYNEIFSNGSVSLGLVIGTLNAQPLILGTNNVERMRILSTGNVGIGITTPNAVALLHMTSTTKGFLPPYMTTTQKAAISTPPDGLWVHDLTLHAPAWYNGTVWKTVAPIESPSFTTPNIGVASGTSLAVTGGFGCNGAAIQTAYPSGGALAGYVTGAYGYDTADHASKLYAMVVAIRAALVANGIMS